MYVKNTKTFMEIYFLPNWAHMKCHTPSVHFSPLATLLASTFLLKKKKAIRRSHTGHGKLDTIKLLKGRFIQDIRINTLFVNSKFGEKFSRQNYNHNLQLALNHSSWFALIRVILSITEIEELFYLTRVKIHHHRLK